MAGQSTYIYLDNAATTFPKPPQVISAMAGAARLMGGNPGRGGHRLSLRAGRIIHACREEAALMLHMDAPERIIFTKNCTEALNLAISGILSPLPPGKEVICSHGEHNAVMRLLDRYVSSGRIRVKMLLPEDNGVLLPQTLQDALTPDTALVILCHASNVTGVIQPAAQMGNICRRRGIPFVVDAAQTAGVLDVSPDALQADMVAMPGHKGLLGPMGTGLLALAATASPEPLMLGGTGSVSESLRQPEMLPDRYESGTQNLPGLAGLLCGIRFVRRRREEIHQYEVWLNERFADRMAEMRCVRLLAGGNAPRVGITSLVPQQTDPGALADALDQCGVAIRSGLHCAPAIHRWLGTLSSGAARFSFGPFNTRQEVDDAALIVRRLLKR